MRKFIGNRAFYSMVLAIVIPIMIQNGITNFVSLLDNIMVGRIGTEQMSGVAIANQLIFVYNLCIFGAAAGAGIFGAQYFGSGNMEYLRYTFRFKFIVCSIIAILAIAIFCLFDTQLVGLYLHESESASDLSATLNYAKSYFRIIIIGLLPFAWAQMYSGTLRETGQTVIPMVASIVAVMVNLIGNFILIFGLLGAPALGVRGAAISTVLSRFVELIILAVWTRKHADTNPYIIGAYRSLYIPGKTFRAITAKSIPLLMNESLWSLGLTTMVQCYSRRGLDTVAAQNITSTISNLFNVVYLSMGVAISIILGQMLGAGKTKEAPDTNRKLMAFSVMIATVFGVLMFFVAPLFPALYNTTDSVKTLAADFIIVAACCMPLFAFTNASYFCLRSGGRVFITFLFDSCFVWAISVPLAYFLSARTGLNIVAVYAIVNGAEIVKCIIGFILVKKGIWIKDLAHTT